MDAVFRHAGDRAAEPFEQLDPHLTGMPGGQDAGEPCASW